MGVATALAAATETMASIKVEGGWDEAWREGACMKAYHVIQ